MTHAGIKKYAIVFLIFLFSHSILANSPAKKKTYVTYDRQTQTLSIGKTQISAGIQLECGYYNDQALYASFGLETQLITCAKLVFPISIKRDNLFLVVQLAPIYESIQHQNSTPIIYGRDAQGRLIDGNNPYNDWYKNLGSQVYYLGGAPVVEAYAGYNITHHNTIIIGRIKNQIGLSDDDTPWGSDGKFAPYSYWLTRDLLTGAIYRYTSKLLNMQAGVLSGNNPMKGYANYLNGIQTPNLKANNTPSLSLNINFNVGHFFNPENTSKINVGGINNTLGSSYVAALQDGKRRNSSYAAALLIDLPVRDNLSFSIFGQYTLYLSGLTASGVQNIPSNPLFRDISQDGFFIGETTRYRSCSLSYTYERFDRFDFNVYNQIIINNRPSQYSLKQLEGLQQSSQIINFQYAYNSHISMILGYQTINNPLMWVSDILNNKPSYRLKAAVLVYF